MNFIDNVSPGTIIIDSHQEFYLRVDDPEYPWRFLDSLTSGGAAEPRGPNFPHEPTVIVAVLDKSIYAKARTPWPHPRRSGGPQYTP